MNCPVCNHDDTKVVDSRVISEGLSIRRRRECIHCLFRFSTYEHVEILGLTVVKQDGRREAYNRDKLERGLKKSLEKRPITQERFLQMIARIERAIQKLKKQEVTSSQIGEIAMRYLKKLDKIAYIRFASIYKSFEDVSTFQKELSSLIETKKAKKKK